jgi:hypothetical protein
MENIKFKHPFTALVAGPTGCGKTVLIRRILKNYEYLTTISGPLKVLWGYGQWQSCYSEPIDGVEIKYIDGLPSLTDLEEEKPQLVIIDDLMSEVGNDKKVGNLFTKGSHHMGISVIFVVQNMFHQGSQMRTISLNSHYIIILKNPRDRSQVGHLGRQLFPSNGKYFLEAFSDATSKPYGYLCIDLTPSTPDKYRVRTRITPEETIHGIICPIIYIPK